MWKGFRASLEVRLRETGFDEIEEIMARDDRGVLLPVYFLYSS